jgi:hypothetical protein
MADDEVTDKLFPPEERPIPLRPSIREEFAAHHLAIRADLERFRVELAAALARLTPPVTTAGAIDKAKAGALAGLRYGGVALALGEAGAEVAKLLGRPDIEGPVRLLIQLLGGS